MGISFKDVGLGAATGGLYNVGKELLKKKTMQTEPPEVTQARQALAEYSKTGKWGDFQAGAAVPLGYGDYNTTAIEDQGLSSLQNLLQSGIPDQYRMGDQAIQNILNQGPQDVAAQFDPFKAQVSRQTRDATNAAKRNSSFMGNLYSTNTIKSLGDVQARGNETLTSELARLTDQALQRDTQAKLQAIPLAFQSGSAQENIAQNRIGSAMQYGGLTRQLNDASIKARDAELLRRRQELQLPIQAATSVANGNYSMPVQYNPYQELLNMAGQIGGTIIGQRLFTGGSGGASTAAPSVSNGRMSPQYQDMWETA